MARYDALVVGAGFAGLYKLHKLRSLGVRCRDIAAKHDHGFRMRRAAEAAA